MGFSHRLRLGDTLIPVSRSGGVILEIRWNMYVGKNTVEQPKPKPKNADTVYSFKHAVINVYLSSHMECKKCPSLTWFHCPTLNWKHTTHSPVGDNPKTHMVSTLLCVSAIFLDDLHSSSRPGKQEGQPRTQAISVSLQLDAVVNPYILS